MAGGGTETDKRFRSAHSSLSRHTLDYPRDFARLPRGHSAVEDQLRRSCTSLSFSIVSRSLPPIVVSHGSIYKMVPTYRRRAVDERLSVSLATLLENRFLF